MSIGVDIVRGQAIQTIGDAGHLDRLNLMPDSRKIVADGLFVPLVGEHFNGHHYLEQAIEHGAVAAIWMEREPLPEHLPQGFPLFFVRDTLSAIQSMAKSYLNQTRPKIIAVTGSNGKTTTKDMLYGILHQSFRTYKTQGNFNNHIGVPLTILSMPKDTEVLVLEMGMNHFGELTFLSQMAKPDIAIITNIGESHIEYLGSREGIAKAKLEIVNGLRKRGTLILDGDEPLLADIQTYAFQIVRCGFSNGNNWRITDIVESVSGSSFSLNKQKETFNVPVLGRHNVKNAVLSFAAARILGMDMEKIRIGLEKLSLTKLRFERVDGLNGSVLINDCYNASPTSMKASLETLKTLPGFKKRIAVLGDMYELGKDEEALHKSVAAALGAPLTHVVTIGEKGAWIADGLRENGGVNLEVRSFPTKAEAQPYLESLLSEDAVMLFKASRLLALEELSGKLCAK
ncbi:UDP-N-acetylmuramoyl-tripeptide--D-alanyl-D-alanine ligase [Sporolactobacillus laevolacticus]|uniref:UDP-N-acetylmuramoyl-tripeptide--D-alanyl-D-alanine ligase n=1 Tax=Sporolactobacillus laevolacticus DSM 442 TaxID=1395513 RepID=V6J028_9BACL|nr:UDP-N-acetylmuramoyl-tripeptide--D-alanyl-D-alanine ligase [Sporolactobacillus laevolacticus]EST13145.1 UDP-N-acetylmuramoylalanyl-D-glutamate--2,6-diaminopimelate ligase [Sporolactobacillus laevolacticus DSM 442]